MSQSQGPEERWSVGRLLTWTAEFLRKKGSETPRLDAEVLLANVLKCERVKLYIQYDVDVSDRDRSTFRELVKRRAEGAPVAYLVGKKEFFSLAFQVGPAVLIPRPDSESVVVEFLTLFKAVKSPRAVDVGTGSGCLAIACTHSHPTACFVAIDNNPDALAMAKTNARTHALGDRIMFRLGNLLDPVSGEEPFDAIVSNPPYIATDVIPTLEPGVRDFEPHSALDGGADGLRVVSALIKTAVPRLKPGGVLILEIGSDQEQPVRALIEACPGFTLAPTIRDHANHPRVIRATRS